MLLNKVTVEKVAISLQFLNYRHFLVINNSRLSFRAPNMAAKTKKIKKSKMSHRNFVVPPLPKLHIKFQPNPSIFVGGVGISLTDVIFAFAGAG